METYTNKAPNWFMVLAIIFLLWNIVGVFSFIGHTFLMTEELKQALPDNERALYDQFPFWTTIVFAIAVATGFMGSLGLVMKRKWANPVFTLSMLAIIPQMTFNLFFTDSIAVYGIFKASLMPILVIVFGAFLIWLSAYANKKGWMR